MKRERATNSTMIGIPSSCRNLYHMEASPTPAAALPMEVTINAGRSTIHSPRVKPASKLRVYFVLSSTLPDSPTLGRTDLRSDSVGPPAACHPRQPPAIDTTFRYPIFCRLSDATAD